MPTQYVCRKCGKIHSKQEYEESKFCKSCDSFLQIKFTKKLIHNHPQSSEQKISVDKSSKDKMGLMRAVESLRKRVTDQKEYDVIPETQEKTQNSMTAQMWIWNEDYANSLKLEKKLLKKYNGKKLEDVIAG